MIPVNARNIHNQCLAIQAIAILLERAGRRGNGEALWTYEHAARHVLPAMYEGCPEMTMPPRAFRPRGADYLPKVMIRDEHVDDDATRVNIARYAPSKKAKGVQP